MSFDEYDLRIAKNQAELGYHYFEWLAAVLLYHTYGYLSLVEQYQFKNHKRKHAILKRLVEPRVIEFIQEHPAYGNIQCPDLLVYKPDESDWFFCEVKSPNDTLREKQVSFFRSLSRVSRKPVRLVEFRYLSK
jgi:hypothetical protein